MSEVTESQIKWKSYHGGWLSDGYGLCIRYEDGRYKPTLNGTRLVVGGLYTLEAAKQVCVIFLNDQQHRKEHVKKAA